ncbi:hypothetical protein O6H91_01G022000 [Diphasiastrum complanatum]|uniref:Uncharacterized protein n=1 Tax=Diphasiastrum complanatum TaxID=34168 RepID=A0ACC2EP22_DIPCM|nr:hypothetical protein O6H91_01G022000 [Diphasiastrum complanatum]
MSHEKFQVSKFSKLQAAFLELDQGIPLPNGWEKCLDLKSGRIYYKSLHTGVKTNEDPRKHLGALSKCLAFPVHCFGGARANIQLESDHRNTISSHLNSMKEGTNFLSLHERNTSALKEGDLALKLSLPGFEFDDLQRGKARKTEFNSQTSNNSQSQTPILSTLSTMSSLSSLRLSLRSSCLFEATSSSSGLKFSHRAPCNSWTSSASSSSPSAMSFQGDVDEIPEVNSFHAVQISRKGKEAEPVLVAVGCQRCLMYVMLSKENPQCPKCGNMFLLDFPSPPANRESHSFNTTLKRNRG